MEETNYKYSIVSTSDEYNLPWDKLQNQYLTGKKNNDKTKIVVKWIGDQPSELNNAKIFVYSEIMEEFKKEEWIEPLPTIIQEYLDGL
tara:strand:+ start:1789 stop:2052 length:264 start_codon:yes stop_codon:yes gene_type:complete